MPLPHSGAGVSWVDRKKKNSNRHSGSMHITHGRTQERIRPGSATPRQISSGASEVMWADKGAWAVRAERHQPPSWFATLPPPPAAATPCCMRRVLCLARSAYLACHHQSRATHEPTWVHKPGDSEPGSRQQGRVSAQVGMSPPRPSLAGPPRVLAVARDGAPCSRLAIIRRFAASHQGKGAQGRRHGVR